MNLNGHYALTPEALNGLFPLADQLQASANKPTSTPDPYQIGNQAAIINISGYIFPTENIFTLFGFGVSLDALAKQLSAAANDPAVKKIVFNFDSPGGNVTGINEFSNQIEATAKPTVAYVSGTAASAAYWLASACNEIVVDATAVLGSIGIVAVMRSPDSNLIEIVSTNASDKRPDPTTDQGKNTIRATLNELEAVFHGSVSMRQPALSIEALKELRGGVRVGANAVSAGLADRVGNMTSVIYGQQAPGSASATQTTATPQASTDDFNGWSQALSNAANLMDQMKCRGNSLKVVIGGFKEPNNAPPVKRTEETTQASADDNGGWGAAFKKAKNPFN